MNSFPLPPTRFLMPIVNLSVALTALAATRVDAQQPFVVGPKVGTPAASASAYDALPVAIGQATRGDTTYAVSATAPLNSPVKGQRLRLLVRGRTVGGTETGFVLINTGKSKTLGELTQTLAQAMRHFAAGGAPAGQEFAKIGDIRYGGEMRLVAETPDRLVFRYDPPTPHPVSVSRADALAFANILEGKS